MKSFKQLREATKPKGNVVYSGKAGGSIKKTPVSITKDSKGFVVTIDGDTLDTFKTEKEAMSALKITVKELGGNIK